MTKLQEEINALGANQIVDYYNKWATHHGEDTVAKFKNLREGREQAYALQWRNGMDEEAPAPAKEAASANQFKPNGPDASNGKAAAKTAKAKKAPPAVKETKETEEKPAKAARKEAVEKGPLETIPGTHKHRVVQLLLGAKGKAVRLGDLAAKVYGDGERIANVKMVLKGVAKAVEVDPHYKLSVTKEEASLVEQKR